MHLYSAFITSLKGALQWSIYPQRTGSIYRRKLQPLLSSPCMLVLILPTSEGWKAEWTTAGKKVAKYSSLGRTGNGTRDLRVGRQRSYHCANPSAEYTFHLSASQIYYIYWWRCFFALQPTGSSRDFSQIKGKRFSEIFGTAIHFCFERKV